MTKEIAYDYLKGKKVKMDIRPITIQEKLQEIGFRWNQEDGKVTIKDVYGICLGLDGIMRWCDWEDSHLWDGFPWEEISTEELLAIGLI